MKKWLAVDTSTDALSIALAEGSEDTTRFKIIASQSSAGNRQHGETLVTAVQQIMTTVGWQARDIGGIIIGVGPGSYTGLRIGVTFAKVWANSYKIPLYTISSLALMLKAEPADETGEESVTLTMPLMNARRQTVYTGAYIQSQQSIEQIKPDQHIPWSDWLQGMSPVIEREQINHVQLIGQDMDEFIDLFKEEQPDTDFTTITGWEAYPHAVRAFDAEHRRLLEEVTDLDVLTPNYAHATLAEQEWAAKNDTHVANSEENEGFIEHFSE